MAWIKQISKKKLQVMDYLLNLSTSGVKLDEIGLLIVSHMYNPKLCVLMKDHYWCLLDNSSVEESVIRLAYRGNVMFSDIRKKDTKPTKPTGPTPKPSRPR